MKEVKVINSTWFEVKVSVDRTDENGATRKVKELYSVNAFSFTEAEARTMAHILAIVEVKWQRRRQHPTRRCYPYLTKITRSGISAKSQLSSMMIWEGSQSAHPFTTLSMPIVQLGRRASLKISTTLLSKTTRLHPFPKLRCWRLSQGKKRPRPYRNDGLSLGLVNITFPKWRAESVKALGNAIVPQVIYEIFKSIENYDK